MEQKIRILSYQNAQNFGALLQAYGLMRTIEKMGFSDVMFINYNPSYLSKRYRVFRKLLPQIGVGIKSSLIILFNTPFLIFNRIKRKYLFKQSKERLIKQDCRKIKTVKDIRDFECNYLICGSDQIWSTWITGGPDPVFYGIGDYKNLRCKIAYAPSTELSTFDKPEVVKEIGKLLDNFDYLSVREKSVKDRLENITQKEISICVDPTILCGSDDYNLIASKRIVKEDYILVYAYNPNDTLIRKIIDKIPNRKKYKIHYILFGTSGIFETFNRQYHSELKIENFLSLFKYSSYVVTNSFHGLAFSLLFERQFNVSNVDGKSARCISLLDQIDCLHRFIKDETIISWDNIDYEKVNISLDVIRNNSLDFLKKSLNCI